MAHDIWKELDLAIERAGRRATFDPDRSTAKPCIICLTTSEPRQLVTIGTYTRRMGGNILPGDPIDRPMCAACEALTAGNVNNLELPLGEIVCACGHDEAAHAPLGKLPTACKAADCACWAFQSSQQR